MSKNDQYRQLIADVRTVYQSEQRELKWCDECQEINLWTYWQGRRHLDARIMLWGRTGAAHGTQGLRRLCGMCRP